ncbi:thioesterase family protein [Nonomuraea fuscirosea]|uniref:thioesterase family protein n=1 Tax=Nonomuraea fuscirosea TaxID=1291556 RepID=UPI003795A4AC
MSRSSQRKDDLPVKTAPTQLPVHGSRTITVAAPDCASQWGNDGLDVLSTPAILGHMERLCVDTLAAHLSPGDMTVGTGVQMRHLAPTNLGQNVTFQVTADRLTRNITVSFQVTDADSRLLSDGTHQRVVINEATFRARLSGADADRRSTP